MGRPRRLRASSLLAALGFLALLLGDGLLSVANQNQSPVLIEMTPLPPVGNETSVQYRITATHGEVPVHAALVSGRLTPTVDRTLYVWVDPQYPAREAAPTDLYGLELRVQQDLRQSGSPLHVAIADTPRLLQVLTDEPRALIAVFGGATLPDPLLAGSAPLLRHWVQSGGTLFWGGTPVGFYDGRMLPNGTLVTDDLGWNGQERLFGFPVEDPIGDPSIVARGPLLADRPGPLAAGLGLDYPGAADGANVSQVYAHGGTSLGYLSAPSTLGSASGRTSLAYLPIGSGGVFYFGGAIWTSGLGSVPSADLVLSDDLALLAGMGFVPAGSGESSIDLVIPNGETVTATLSVPQGEGPILALVSAKIAGNLLGFEAIQISR